MMMAIQLGTDSSMHYLESRNFTEPAFVFVIMVIAASRPIIDFAGALLVWVSRILPLPASTAYYATVLSIGPLLGSFITEPAAMTLSALLLRERFIQKNAPNVFKYGTLGVLFVNVSIGGVLTPFAAGRPPLPSSSTRPRPPFCSGATSRACLRSRPRWRAWMCRSG